MLGRIATKLAWPWALRARLPVLRAEAMVRAKRVLLVVAAAAVATVVLVSEYEDALRELGCTEPDDLRALEEADMMEIGMKRIEIKRLGRLYK